MLIPNYTDEYSLRIAIKNSKCIKDVLEKIGINLTRSQGYYYRMFHKTVKELDIPIKHFDQYHKNRKIGFNNRKYSNKEVFTKNFDATLVDLRKRMIEIGFDYICSVCNLEPTWNGKPLTLQVDHIDGNPLNNERDNLRFLCPNCHTQTPTFGGKNSSLAITKKKEKMTPKKKKPILRPKKIKWPNAEEILKRLDNSTYVQLGRELNVSDNAIRKFLRRNNIIPPKRYGNKG